MNMFARIKRWISNLIGPGMAPPTTTVMSYILPSGEELTAELMGERQRLRERIIRAEWRGLTRQQQLVRARLGPYFWGTDLTGPTTDWLRRRAAEAEAAADLRERQRLADLGGIDVPGLV